MIDRVYHPENLWSAVGGFIFQSAHGLGCAVGLMLLLLVVTPTWAQNSNSLDIPLVEQTPFDLIQLDDVNGNATIKIKPLAQPLPDPLPTQGTLIFEAPELSDDRLEVPFENIVKYRSFNDLLRTESNQFIRQEEYGKAFRNLIYIYDHGGKADPTVANTIQNLLFRDAIKNYQSGNFELALTIFQDIYERDKNFEVPGISRRPIDLILDSQDQNIESRFAAGRFAQVRAALDDLVVRYGPAAEPTVKKWRDRLQTASAQMLAEARQIAASGNGKLAHLTARRANSILPDQPEAFALFQEIVQQYPIVFVGVSQSTRNADPLNLDHWGTRRIGKLIQRSVVEFAGPGDDGGKYEFLNGSIEQIDDNGFEFRFTIVPDSNRFAVPPVNAYQLSRHMLSRGSIQSDNYNVPFAKVVDTIQIEDENKIVVRFNKAFIRPEALFQFPYETEEGQDSSDNGKYVLTESNDEITIFEKNPNYPDIVGHQHPQIVEWQFPSASKAVGALVSGEIDVVDRIPLSELNRLEENAAIEVGSYIVPTVHMLVPNIRNDFTADRSFRNGLMQGINRELILQELICGGREVDGCEVISGPFPIGTEENDQLSYAYNLSVQPQPFNDQLGMVLARVIYETQLSLQVRKGVQDPSVEFPTLVLAYAAEEVPEIACTNIQQMWEAMGLNVVLRELDAGLAQPPDDDWDFLYYQMSMEEPLTNAELLFGTGGVVKSISAPVQQNMQELGYSESWRNAGVTLRRIHRQVVNDVTIIPLWQLKEHFAYRDNLKGIGKTPVHLYQNVEHWRIESRTENN